MSSCHSTRRHETATVALVVALLLAPVGPITGFGHGTAAAQQGDAVLTVDDDGGANYTTIAAAVGDASPNDTVRVRPGTYDESVTVDKNVTVVAPDGALVTGTFSIGAETRPVSPAIIGFTITPDTGGADIAVAADDSTGDWELRDVEIRGSETDVGVDAGTSSGDWILRDVVLSNINDTRAISIDAVGSSGDWQLRNVTIRGTRAGEAIDAFGSVGDWEAHNLSIVDFEETIATETAVTAETSEGDWMLTDVRIEGGDVGVNARATDGNWSITSAAFDGSDVGIDAGNAAGHWDVHQSSFTGNSEHSITAVDATRRGNATRNWWGHPEGPTTEQCLGNVSCSNPLTTPPAETDPPDAVAGADVTVSENSTVRLNGTASTDPDGDQLTYDWTQVAGPTVTLRETATATPAFTAPDVDRNRTLAFVLEVTDDAGNTDTDRVNVTVITRPEVRPPPFPGEANAPTDPDGDGLYENIDGDDTFNIIDVSVFLAKFGSVSAETAAAFDFNGDGRINIIDVAALLDRT